MALAGGDSGATVVARDVVSLGAPTRDGKYLTHVREGNLAWRDLQSGQDRLLTRKAAGSGEFAYFSVPSRDGKRVAYAWFNEAKFYELRMVEVDGGEPRVLYRNAEAGFVQPCAFSADGSKILTLFFRKDNTSQIALVDAASGAVEVLRSLQWVYPKRMDLSPDGKYVVYDSFRPEAKTERAVYVLPLDGSAERMLTPEKGSWLFPLFSLDGQRVLYVGGAEDALELWERKLDGSGAVRLQSGLGRALPLGVVAGERLVYGVREGGSEVYVLGEGGRAWRATREYAGLNRSPVFAPDGRRMAYLSRRGPENYGQESRAIVIRDGEAERELATGMAYVERLAWTAGGLVASGSDGKGRAGAFRIDENSGKTTPLVVEHGGDFRGVVAAMVGAEAVVLKSGVVWRGEEKVGAARGFAVEGEEVVLLEEGRVRWVKGGQTVPCPGCEEVAMGAGRVVAAGPEGIWELGPGKERKLLGRVGKRVGPVAVGKLGVAFTVAQEENHVYLLQLPRSLRTPLGLDRHVPAPAENPLTVEKVELGRRLFADKRLSRDGTVACATCHERERAFTDARAKAVGVRGQVGERRTPRIANRAWGKSFFWDGRAKTLEEQVLGPIGNPVEMDLDPTEAARRVGLSVREMQLALASYVRTILAGDAPYDRYLAGEAGALTADQKAGLELFRGKANCAACHLGPNLTDEELHVTGLGEGAFKTPGLRDVARTPPYMHDGQLKTLEEVVEFYNEGGKKHAQLDGEMMPLKLNAVEKRQLVEFLGSLNGRVQDGY